MVFITTNRAQLGAADPRGSLCCKLFSTPRYLGDLDPTRVDSSAFQITG
jgi:hypothetical protein